MARKPQRSAKPRRSRARPAAARRHRPRKDHRGASWRCSPRSASRRSASATSRRAPASRSRRCAASSARRSSILAAHMKELDRKVLAGGECRHGRGAAARAAVRRADAPHRGDGALSRGDALADALGVVQSGARAWRSTALAVRSQTWMLDRRRHRRGRPARRDPRAGPGDAVRLGAAHLGRRRRRGPRAHARGARPRARARPALVRHARRSLPLLARALPASARAAPRDEEAEADRGERPASRNADRAGSPCMTSSTPAPAPSRAVRPSGCRRA